MFRLDERLPEEVNTDRRSVRMVGEPADPQFVRRSDRFLEFLINELQTYDLSPGAVCFEITETAAISNLANVVHFMREFRTRGCLFSLDDFGSGLSSFMYLKNLPVDYL